VEFGDMDSIQNSLETYWCDFWNVLDNLVYLGIIVLEILIYSSSHARSENDADIFDTGISMFWMNVTLSLFIIFAWVKAPFFLSISGKLGPLIESVSRMSKDITVFVILSIFVLVGFAQIFTFLLFSQYESFSTLSGSMYTLLFYGLGNYDFVTDSTGINTFIVNTLLILYLLLILILLVNLLIAMMGKTYESSIEEGKSISRGKFVELYLQYKEAYWIPPINWIKAIIDLVIFIKTHFDDNEYELTENEDELREKERAMDKLLLIYTEQNQALIDSFFSKPQENYVWDLYTDQSGK